MKNSVLLFTLFAEYASEMSERTMKIEDMKAIERVQELLSYELPKRETMPERRNLNGRNQGSF